jgi:prolyl-tRNA editing enzyme YbaK/EbsC (Cys-tRNA(Pro) deacylase)
MKPANLKVKTCLESFGFELEIRILPDAVRTAQLAADAIGCQVGQIANSLIFKESGEEKAVLIMCSGGRRVDLKKVQQLTGLELGKADAEFVRTQTGFVIGGVPPVAHAQLLRCLLDISLLGYDQIWAAAGTPESIFPMNSRQLQHMTAGEWVDVAQDQ